MSYEKFQHLTNNAFAVGMLRAVVERTLFQGIHSHAALLRFSRTELEMERICGCPGLVSGDAVYPLLVIGQIRVFALAFCSFP